MTRSTRRLLLLAAVAVAIALFLQFDLGEQLSFARLKEQQDRLAEARAAAPLLFLAGYFLSYVLVAGLSLPGATVMTLAGGAVFGLALGARVLPRE